MKSKYLNALMGIILISSSQVNYADDKPLDSIVRGSGAGGTITIMNNTLHDIYVTWSGSGCAGATWGLDLVCEKAKFTRYTPYQRQTYKYNWGVTGTWVNIASAIEHTNKPIGDLHPCSDMSGMQDACIFDHKSVTTYGDYETYCNFGFYQGAYYLDCDKVAN